MTSLSKKVVNDEKHLDLLSNVDFSPIFIMGDHRSGTTLLYKTLAATKCFNFVKAYHIIKYDEILSNHINQTESQSIQELNSHFKSLGISDRTIDRVVATPTLPEEYGFILKNMVGDESFITPKNLTVFRQMCRKIQFSSDFDKPLLLKNPWDFPQFMYVKTSIPNAKFIFINRHPIHVINSKLKAARTLLSSWNPYVDLIAKWYRQIFNNPIKRNLYKLFYSNYFDLGLRRVTTQSIKSTTYYLKNIEKLADADYISVRYEDLCQEPETTIQSILVFLGLEARSTLEYQKLIRPRSIDLLPEVQRQYEQIHQKLHVYFDYEGYAS